MAEDQNGRTKILNKTFNAWLMGLLLLIVVCVAIPELFPALSWTHFVFPVAVVAGPVALMILERRTVLGKPRDKDKGIGEKAGAKPEAFNEKR
jgi:FtsH-binding integral membrane protein